uniref:Uncharacterized protein n=1 Tax=Anopheles quadriannulatus TaxID=34691 RepID=A0A182XPD0_ANOQN
MQTGVALFGIVTTQKADPQQSGIEHLAGEQATLKAYMRVQLTLVVRYYARWFGTTHADAVRAESRRLEHAPDAFVDGKFLEECMVRFCSNVQFCCESTSFDRTMACITDVRSVPAVSRREPVRAEVSCPVTTKVVATETRVISGSVIGRVAEFFRVSLCI